MLKSTCDSCRTSALEVNSNSVTVFTYNTSEKIGEVATYYGRNENVHKLNSLLIASVVSGGVESVGLLQLFEA